ncbi:hypothetical protein HUF15_27155 [Streptomyces samsunensis]|uniref:hypothetical protein n=1 Tax=Streptomyces malaysiensis TaxID=92644 RepID=UPI0015825D2E|nr:hypothetical protein [Streptomyces samsunensis]NUH40397.1 hypothetical protein [Streptomyces samsunensis]
MSVSELRASDITRTARLVGCAALTDRTIARLTSGIAASGRGENDHPAWHGGFIGEIDAQRTADAAVDAGHKARTGHTASLGEWAGFLGPWNEQARVEGERRQSAESTVFKSLDSLGSTAAMGFTLEDHIAFDLFPGSATERNPGCTTL